MQANLTAIGVLRVWLVTVCLLAAGALYAAQADDKVEILKLEQIELNEGHIKGYLKIGPKLAQMFDRIDKAGETPDAKLTADLEALAKEGGFDSFDDLETALSNITFVMSGINEDDGSFSEPVDVLKQELADTEADKELKGEDKAELIAAIKDSIKHTPKLQHRGNVALVQKHFKALAKLFEE